MVCLELLVKVGPKGQVLIPKIFRNAIGISPGLSVVLEGRQNEIVLRKPAHNLAKVLEETAFSGKSVRVGAHDAHEEELEARLEG